MAVMDPLPSREVADADRFRVSKFENIYATSEATALLKGLSAPNMVSGTTWRDYIDFHEAFKHLKMEKLARPALVHGACTGWHSNESMRTVDALVVDSDKGGPPLDLGLLGDLQYLYQERVAPGDIYKWHLILPLSEPFEGTGLGVCASYRLAAVQKLEGLLGYELDKTTAVPCAYLLPYCRYSDDDPAPRTVYNVSSTRRFDILKFTEGFKPVRQSLVHANHTTTQADSYGQDVRAGFVNSGLKIEDHGNGWWVQCPFERFHTSVSETLTSTTIVMPNGHIVCQRSHCAGRAQAEFLAALKVAPGNHTMELQLALEAARTEKISVAEAARRIRQVLDDAKPWERTASVVRVSTGAGKTRQTTEFLDDYCAPTYDPDSGEVLAGRAAVFAVPTNALLREVAGRLRIDFKTATGVLAVLNDDGEPACRKHEAAKALQAAGGDVHRLMCARCEYREGCPARDNARQGEGALTLTNHALLPTIVKELRGQGRVPLVLWDECPEMVSTVELPFVDLDWMLARFSEEERPRLYDLDDLANPPLFSSRTRVVMRPLLSVLGLVRGLGSLNEALAAYGAVRISESQLGQAAGLLGVALTGGLWDRICQLANVARGQNVSEMMFDSMSKAQQADTLRAAGIEKALSGLLLEGCIIKKEYGGLRGTCLTEAGKLWKQFGGVILDATAPGEVLKAVNPATAIVDLAVEDAGKSTRLVVQNLGLSRRALGRYDKERRMDVLDDVAKTICKHLRSVGKTLGREPKAVIFTYKAFLPMIRSRINLAGPAAVMDAKHFGDLRGYNKWHDEGFDVFITIGDPVVNVEASTDVATLLGIDPDTYGKDLARAELAQAHGRSRSPQQKLFSGDRLHLHFGRLAPLGWDADNSGVWV